MSVNTIENTPAGCHGCHNFDDCVQAKHMNANTEPVEGWVCDGEVYCGDCGSEGPSYEDSDSPTPYGGESDTPTHCGGCGVPIIHELTIDGVEYVRKALADGGGCCAELWPVIWGDYAICADDDDDVDCEVCDDCDGCDGCDDY